MDNINQEKKQLEKYLEQLDNIEAIYYDKFKDYTIEKLEKKINKTNNIEKQIKYYQYILHLLL
jgi:hypothetical protein